MENSADNSENRVSIINSVKTYLGFFVLLVLVVEASLGAIALKTEGNNQLYTIIGMIIILLGLISVVTFFAYKKPEVLLQKIGSQNQNNSFIKKISGYWWQSVDPDNPCAISYVEITPLKTENTISLKGTAFNKNGESVTIWKTESSFIDFAEKKLIYAWKRENSIKGYTPYEGFGEIYFQKPIGIKARGSFLDYKSGNVESTKQFYTNYWRLTEDERLLVCGIDEKAITKLVLKKLKGLK